MMRGTIQCGAGPTEKGVIGEATPVWLEESRKERYVAGSMYTHSATDVHESRPAPGTVTLVMRTFDQPDTEHARVYWPAGTDWVSAEPRPAHPLEVQEVCNYAYNMYFRSV
jgi:hypothetical protein